MAAIVATKATHRFVMIRFLPRAPNQRAFASMRFVPGRTLPTTGRKLCCEYIPLDLHGVQIMPFPRRLGWGQRPYFN
jgi:hypothetical protein